MLRLVCRLGNRDCLKNSNRNILIRDIFKIQCTFYSRSAPSSPNHRGVGGLVTSEPVSPESSPVPIAEQPVALDYVSQSAPGSPRNNILPTHYLPAGIYYFDNFFFLLVQALFLNEHIFPENLTLSNCSSSGTYTLKDSAATMRVYLPKTPVIVQSASGSYSP